MNRKKMVAFVLAVFMAASALTGCNFSSGAPAVQKSASSTGVIGNASAPAAFMTLKDDAGRTVSLEKKPERIAVLSTSFLDLLYEVGGKAVGRPTSKSANIPKEAVGIDELGQNSNINTEKLISLNPDLVIGYQGVHEKLIPLMESSGIPIIMLKMKTYDDILAKIKLFGDITGNGQRAQELWSSTDKKVKDIVSRLPAQKTKVVILFASTQFVKVELNNTIAGNTAEILKLNNIALGSKPLEDDPDSTPFSLEKIIEADPDVILINTMGNLEEMKKRMKNDVESNPAWGELRAVKEKKVYYLPKDLFLLNPGLKIYESIEYMAKIVYPEVFGSVE